MESIIPLLIIVAIIVTVAKIQNKREDKKAFEEREQQMMSYIKEVQQGNSQSDVDLRQVKTRDLFLETLTKMGCEYQIEEDDRICFMWQGGFFVADASNECLFINIWYTQWGEWELYDIDTLSRVKRIINDANYNYGLNVLYSINEAGGNFYVHSKRNFLFIPQIPAIKDYLQAILGDFFSARRYVETELEKMKNEEERVNS